MIALQAVRKTYGGRTYAVDAVDLTVERGELLVSLGESGLESPRLRRRPVAG